jgi:hypothetical protein
MPKSKEKENGCCKNEQKYVKLDNDQKISEISLQLIQLSHFNLAFWYSEVPVFKIASITEENPVSHAPPQIGKVATYIRNCSFRI